MKYTLYLITTLVLFTSAINSHEVEALSCLFVPARIATISSEKMEDSYGDFATFELEDITILNREVAQDTLFDHKYIYDISRSNPSIIASSISTEWSPEHREIFLPREIRRSVNQGDIIVSAGNESVADCGGNSLTTIFDSQTREAKFAIYSGVPVGTYTLNDTEIVISSIDTPDDATEIVTLYVNQDRARMRHGDTEYFEDDTVKLLHLKSSYSQETIWGGRPYASFFVELHSQNTEQPQGDLCSIDYSRLIRYGRRGNDVAQVQSCLNNLGYNTGVVDGIYGPNTFQGITSFQISQNILVDGIVGPQTVEYLNRR